MASSSMAALTHLPHQRERALINKYCELVQSLYLQGTDRNNGRHRCERNVHILDIAILKTVEKKKNSVHQVFVYIKSH